MGWDWKFVWDILPTLIQGVKITIIATLLGSVPVSLGVLHQAVGVASFALWISWLYRARDSAVHPAPSDDRAARPALAEQVPAGRG